MSTCISEFYYSSHPKLRIIKPSPFLSDKIAKLELCYGLRNSNMQIPFLVDTFHMDLLKKYKAQAYVYRILIALLTTFWQYNKDLQVYLHCMRLVTWEKFFYYPILVLIVLESHYLPGHEVATYFPKISINAVFSIWYVPSSHIYLLNVQVFIRCQIKDCILRDLVPQVSMCSRSLLPSFCRAFTFSS